MQIHKDIDQGTKEWFMIKWGKVGGTRSKGLFVPTDTLMLELVSERTEDWVDDGGFQSDAMLRGHELEPVAVREVEEFAGVKFTSVGWIDSDIPNYGISPDAISECEKIACEVKCLGGKKHIETVIGDVIPKDYIHQCVHYFAVNPKLEKLYFCAFRPESNVRPVFIKELTRDSVVDLGLTEKGKVTEDRGKGMKEYVATLPVIKTINEWVEISRENMKEVNLQVDNIIDGLKF
jgi:predicted phage-related endonuclease